MKTKLRDHPDIKWRGQPVWDPPSWRWIHGTGLSTQPSSVENGKLVNARPFKDQNGIAAIELSVAFESVTCSTLLRLDNAKAVARLSHELNQLRGFTLKQNGTIEVSLA